MPQSSRMISTFFAWRSHSGVVVGAACRWAVARRRTSRRFFTEGNCVTEAHLSNSLVVDESDLDRIYMMNRMSQVVSILLILFILFILSPTCLRLAQDFMMSVMMNQTWTG